MELPEIHEAKRLTLNPGDVLVLRNTGADIGWAQAREIEELVRAHLKRPALNVMVTLR